MTTKSKAKPAPLDPFYGLPADEHVLTEAQAAKFLGGVSPRSMQRWRLAGTGPRYSKVGRLIRYLRSDLLAYARAQSFHSTSHADVSRRSRKPVADLHAT